MKNFIKNTVAALGVLAGLCSVNAIAANIPDEINFGIIATDAQQNLKQRWEPILQDLGKELGIPVNAYFAPDYAGIIQGMRFKKVDFGYFGNKSAMEAVDRANAEIFARYIDQGGEEGYYSVLIAHRDNQKINSLDDVLKHHKTLTLANGEPNSTSGFLVPNYHAFARNDISANDFHRTIVANHGASTMAVVNKQVDVATNHTMNLVRLQDSSPQLLEQLKVIWQSELIPSDVLTWRKDLPESLREQAREFFLSYAKDGNEQHLKNLELLSWQGFAPADNNQLLPIRQMETYKNLIETQQNERLNKRTKRQRIAKFEQELQTLEQQINALEG